MAARPLTPKQLKFVAAYIGPAKGNATEAAFQAGYRGTRHTLQTIGTENMSKPVVAAAIAAWRDEVRTTGIASLDYRVKQLEHLEQNYLDLMAARRQHYGRQVEAVGGGTGTVVGTLKKVTHHSTTKDGEPVTWVEEVWQFEADTAVTKELRAIYDDVAKELGQRQEQVHLGGTVTRRYIFEHATPSPPPDDADDEAEP